MKRLILAVFLAAVLFSGVAFAEEATNTWTINYATPSIGLYGNVATVSYPLRSGVPPLMYIGNVASKSIEYVSYDKPLPTVGTFSISSIQIFEVGGTVATWAHLDAERSQYVNIASMNVPLATGTNVIGKISIDQATAGTTNGVQPAVAALGLPAANTASPFAVQLMVSDGSNLQRILAPLILGDGVNGNNMISNGGWVFNGTTWDRMPGNASGVFAVPYPYQVASTTVGSFTTAAYTIPRQSGARSILITLNDTNKEIWVRLGGDAPTVGNGIRVSSNLFIDDLNTAEVIKVIASETLSGSWVQR